MKYALVVDGVIQRIEDFAEVAPELTGKQHMRWLPVESDDTPAFDAASQRLIVDTPALDGGRVVVRKTIVAKAAEEMDADARQARRNIEDAQGGAVAFWILAVLVAAGAIKTEVLPADVRAWLAEWRSTGGDRVELAAAAAARRADSAAKFRALRAARAAEKEDT
jgi:hypothetical protein